MIYDVLNSSQHSGFSQLYIMTTLGPTYIDFLSLFLPSHSDCAPKTPAPQALDDAAAKKLWDVSASMVGLA